ncbi:DUF3108 domain-containing protein [Oceanobacter mangrovi]|uniref:DUF3108 domain-containing protein n=1 Tax=Oceanobacter mangrovi TaxID=2862510 RepID=UPI001C8DCBA2
MRTLSRLAYTTLLLSSAALANEEQPLSHETVAEPVSSIAATLYPYSAEYDSQYDWGWFSFDIKARQTLEQVDEAQWKLTFQARASAASVEETSWFTLQDGQIHPRQYYYKASGLIQEDDQLLVFDDQHHTVQDNINNRSFDDKWRDDLQDKLTYMAQISLDLANNKPELDYQVFEKHRVRHYRFEVVGEETLNTRIGPLKTIKIRQLRDDKREIMAWLASEKNYLMIKLVDRKKGKKQYQIDLVSTTL